MRYFVLLLLCAKLSADSIPAEMMMSQNERQNMGYDDLTPQQKQAFQEWAARWTQHVLEQAPSYRPGQNLTLWVQSWPAHANPTKTQNTPQEIEQRQLSNQVIDRVRNNGEIIELKDGSSWRVSPFYRYQTTLWQKGQTVEVSQSRNSLHPWLLNNISTGLAVEADALSPASSTGKKAENPPEYYQGAVGIANVTQVGDILTLGDGTVWKVAPADQYKVRNWKPNDRIKVEQSDNFLYHYSLTNLDTGEVALANQPRK